MPSADSNSQADAAHKQFKIHNSYQDILNLSKDPDSTTAQARLVLPKFVTLRSCKEIRNKLDELKPRVDEWRKRRQDQASASCKYIYIYTYIHM